MGLKAIVGSLILSTGMAMSAATQEINSSVAQQSINGGVETSTVGTSVEDNDWSIFANYTEITNLFSEENIFIVGGSIDVFDGVAEFAAINSNSENLFSEEEYDLYLISFERGKIKGTIGSGDGTLARARYQISPEIHAALSFLDNMKQMHTRYISEQSTPIEQHFFFDTLPTRFDIPSLMWNQRLSGLGVELGYENPKNSVLVTYHKGERPFLGIGNASDFAYYRLLQQHEGKFYNTLDIELGKGNHLYEGRIALETGLKIGRLHTGVGGYVHGVADSPSSIFEYYNGAGVSFLATIDLGKVTIGTLDTFEKDRTTGTDLTQLGLLLGLRNHQIIIGPTESTNVHRFFSEPDNGWMFSSKHDLGRWDISTYYVSDNDNDYGMLSVGWSLP
jgi:hypothetical protein